MELFILLVLSFCCCQARPLEGEEVDCDDPTVFSAVDIALRSYNDRSFGNKFALVQVLEARQTAGPNVNHLVKYELKETSCGVGHGGSWQECGYASAADSGTCVAKVHLDKYSTVSQTCTIFRAPEKDFTPGAGCRGCWSPLTNYSLVLLPIVRYTIQKFNSQSDHPSHFEVGKITNAQRQVVSGWKYKFEYSIKETNCSKAEFAELTPACRPIPGGRAGNCEVTAYVSISDKLESVVQDCKLQAPQKEIGAGCLGCWSPLTSDSLLLLPIVRYTIRKFNSQNDHPSHFEVGKITNAQRQLVSGWKYKFEYSIKETNCSKAVFAELTPACRPIPRGRAGNCEVTAYVNISNTLVYAVQNCKLREVARLGCPGCPQKIAIDHPDMLKTLDIALEKFNNESSDSFLYKVQQITAATSQIVAGINYRVEFTVVKTNCSKDNIQKLSKICTDAQHSKPLDCSSTIYVKPQGSQTFPRVACTKIKQIKMYAIPGLTPFRQSRQAVNLPVVFPESKHRTGRGHNHGHKHGHQKQKNGSSEETHDVVTNQEETVLVPGTEIPDQPSTLKRIPREEGPNKNQTGGLAGLSDPPLPDLTGGSPDGPLVDTSLNLTEAPPPRCPGKLWQPLTFPTTPLPMETVSPTG